MMYDLDYDDLPEEIKDILNEGDVYSNSIVRLHQKMKMALAYYELIPDGRIDMVRISKAEGCERLLSLREKLEGKLLYRPWY